MPGQFEAECKGPSHIDRNVVAINSLSQCYNKTKLFSTLLKSASVGVSSIVVSTGTKPLSVNTSTHEYCGLIFNWSL
jgi:hypothetical protein